MADDDKRRDYIENKLASASKLLLMASYCGEYSERTDSNRIVVDSSSMDSVLAGAGDRMLSPDLLETGPKQPKLSVLAMDNEAALEGLNEAIDRLNSELRLLRYR